jgi:formylglycine-generating enzyme required for sulfatase activity
MSQPRVFVSHSHKDNAFTERLVNDLRQAGANAWMDRDDLGAGNFQQRIDEALANCEWFILILTKDALDSPWVQEEVYAAKRLKNQSKIRNLIFIQAESLGHRELPATWGVFNIFDATQDYASARDRILKEVGLPPLTMIPPTWSVGDEERGFLGQQATIEQANQLIRHIPEQQSQAPHQAEIDPAHFPKRLADLGFTAHYNNGVEYILPPLCRVPAGPFLMGSDPKRDKSTNPDEEPQRSVTLPVYNIARYPVTVAEYALFVRAGHAGPPRSELYGEILDWQTQLGKLDHPVVMVSWHDAVAYAIWLSDLTGEQWRLPTEAEWEKAARGTDGRIYPWGDASDKSRYYNTSEFVIKDTTPVGSYPSGTSPYGVEDMAGNVLEWTGSQYRLYPYTISGEREDHIIIGDRVLRGSSWIGVASDVRAAHRNRTSLDVFNIYIGFRLVHAAPSS